MNCGAENALSVKLNKKTSAGERDGLGNSYFAFVVCLKHTCKTKLAYIGRLQCREHKYYTILQASALVRSPFSVLFFTLKLARRKCTNSSIFWFSQIYHSQKQKSFINAENSKCQNGYRCTHSLPHYDLWHRKSWMVKWDCRSFSKHFYEKKLQGRHTQIQNKCTSELLLNWFSCYHWQCFRKLCFNFS